MLYTRVFPLLKLLGLQPAVIALVGRWMRCQTKKIVDYDSKPVPRSKFLSWEQVREMQASGLVEVASAYRSDLHRSGIIANPGNTQPAAVARLYLQRSATEDDAAYLARLRLDCRDSVRRTTPAHAPRVIVWPYGRSNLAAQRGVCLGARHADRR